MKVLLRSFPVGEESTSLPAFSPEVRMSVKRDLIQSQTSPTITDRGVDVKLTLTYPSPASA